MVPRGQSLYQSISGGNAKNYNSEFLIVHARDLIASVSSDQDIMIQTVAKIATGLHIQNVNSTVSQANIDQRKSSDSPKVPTIISTTEIKSLQLVG